MIVTSSVSSRPTICLTKTRLTRANKSAFESVGILLAKSCWSVDHEMKMYTLEVTRDGTRIGCVHFDPIADCINSDVEVPADLMSDIVVTYHRDNVLFGESGDGYRWEEITDQTPEPKPIDCLPAPGLSNKRIRWISPKRR